MRLNALNLLAYGKFTSLGLEFPRGEHDFHVIIGPNEAGKSTVRRAIRELLFGMERQSPLGFLHPQSDLKLQGTLEGSFGTLEFMRTKQQKSLRSRSDEPLPDGYLNPALGNLTEDAFGQLHSLDHTALVKGGRGIVDPSTSVSQMLFQAASGLESFAPVRDALRERSSELFGRGKKNEYSAASERLASAQRVLKDVQVRSKDWSRANETLESARNAVSVERIKRVELEQLRSGWERSRRLGSRIQQYDVRLQQLADMGETIEFPADAKATLEHALSELNAAARIIEIREADAQAKREELAGITCDDAVISMAAEVTNLAALCAESVRYPTDIVLRKNEVQLWIQEALTYSRQFGWGQTEEVMQSRVPSDKVLRMLESLLKERGGLIEGERGAKESERRQQSALDAVTQKLEQIGELTVDSRVELALAQALPYKSIAEKTHVLLGAIGSAKRKVEHALAVLGRDAQDAVHLRGLQLPSLERVANMRSVRQDIVSSLALRTTRAEESKLAAQTLALQVRQFEANNKVVTAAEVSEARVERDNAWDNVKTGLVAVGDGAPRLDATMRLADELADARTLSESAAASLQALRDQHALAEEQAASHAELADKKQLELAEFDALWATQAANWGVGDVEIDDMPGWLTKRDQALAAADALEQKEGELTLVQQSAGSAGNALASAMQKAGIEVAPDAGLAELCVRAEEYVEQARDQRANRKALMEQRVDAEAALKHAKQEVESRTEAVSLWRKRWSLALTDANLQVSDPAEAEAAIHAGREIQALLAKVRDHRVSRIDLMEAELGFLNDTARSLATVLGPELMHGTPQEVSQALSARLLHARAQAEKLAAAQHALADAERLLKQEKAQAEVLRKTLQPLLEIARVEDPLLALPLVERSDRKRELQQESSRERQEIERDSDGLGIDKLRAELEVYPPVDAPGHIQDIKDRLAESDGTMTLLVQSEVAARQAVEAIDGSEKAAIAEAQRQEAISDMSSAGEEYVQLATASALLKWAVDRYRDRKQLPLLDRASSIFESLTTGSFKKLRIDYDQSPPALLAYRSKGVPAKVEGLSDGTRDQLFLALRIAALELHSEQGIPIPFIADDLFINFDDKRSQAGLKALWNLSTKTQVIFLSHQEHLLPVVDTLFPGVNVLQLEAQLDLA